MKLGNLWFFTPAELLLQPRQPFAVIEFSFYLNQPVANFNNVTNDTPAEDTNCSSLFGLLNGSLAGGLGDLGVRRDGTKHQRRYPNSTPFRICLPGRDLPIDAHAFFDAVTHNTTAIWYKALASIGNVSL